MLKHVIVVFAILMGLGSVFYAGVRSGNHFYHWLFYEPFLREYEAHQDCRVELKRLKQEKKGKNGNNI